MGMALIASMNSWTLFLVIIAFILAIQHSIEKTEHLTSHRVGTLVGAILIVILILPPSQCLLTFIKQILFLPKHFLPR